MLLMYYPNTTLKLYTRVSANDNDKNGLFGGGDNTTVFETPATICGYVLNKNYSYVTCKKLNEGKKTFTL